MLISTIILIMLGFAVGAFGTLVGIGGGIILIPVFLLIMNYSQQHTIGTSLAVVFFNSLSGTLAYFRQRKIYFDAGIRFSLATIPGALAGSFLAGYFTDKTFGITFGILLLVIAVSILIRSRKKQTEPQTFDPKEFVYNKPLGIILSFFVGFLSSILGIGGGVIHVPLLIFALGFPTHIATATSHFVLAISSFTGVASHLYLGNILPEPALAIGFGAVLGAQFGARLSLKLNSRPIQIMLALAMFSLGVRLLWANH